MEPVMIAVPLWILIVAFPPFVVGWAAIIVAFIDAQMKRRAKLAELRRHSQHCCEAGPDTCPNIKEEVA